MSPSSRELPEISLRERLGVLLAFRVAIVTILLGGAVVTNASALSSLADPENLTFLSLIVGTYLLTIVYAVGLRFVRNLKVLAVLQIAGDMLLTAILVIATGGLDSLFVFLFYITIINAAGVAGRRTALLAATATAVVFIYLALGATQILVFPDIEVMRTQRTTGALLYEISLHISAAYLVAILAGYLANRLGEVTGELERQHSNVVELRALNANILESLNSGLLTINTDDRIIFFNRAAEDITGHTASEAYGNPLAKVFPELADRLGENPDMPRLESNYTRPGGDEICLGFSVSPLLNSQHQNAGRIVIFQDLSEVKKLELENKRAERLAAIGQLAASIAHEIRNPLASISGSVEMLESMADLDEDDAMLMRIIVREVDRLNHLITDFLDFSRPRPLNIVDTDLIKMTGEVIGLFQNKKSDAHLQVDLEFPDDLDAAPAPVDREALRQILWNLLNNAREAMPDADGAGRIRVSIARTDAQTQWRISVEDNGPGIPAPQLERIFEPFFTTKETGTGLGLATIHRLIKQHDGRIHAAQSDDLGGARFDIEFPVATSLSSPEPDLQGLADKSDNTNFERSADLF
ncbi:two-component system sensor histidine kinase NtrB [Bradymonas sediminis]|uniref:histidine kinase n=1 Tax=Bradymonas sediminis TaxID=1548548 RepID=A0A2Z4FNQ1_9DELT|nr:ATP-binding protein [Bradymonas sediminis]AWV90573.1 hypothetical protein DN745_15050 [Bradymonas sediminis]TDP72030.1 two-component system sensor histidine kinase PilS (NtrC family) [Bradymonas sediminis]